MFNLSTLPRCGAPAVDTIEIYSPAGGAAHGSLDATVHTCSAHVAETMNAATAAGYTPYRLVNLTRVMRCGAGYDFTTGATVYAPQLELDDATHGSSGPGGPLPAAGVDDTNTLEVGTAEYGRHHNPDTDAPAEIRTGRSDSSHPAWCQRGEGSGDTHTGRVVTINSRDGLGSISAQLQLDTWPHAVPLLILTGDGTVLPMSTGQAKALAFSMRALVRLAGVDR